jgi:uncharacterized damage-inducible protein DinB
MSIADSILAELEHEAAGTRKILERVPENKMSWRPHEKSMPLDRLASHVTEMLKWGAVTLKEPEFNITDDYRPWIAKSRAELVAAFDENVEEFKAALRGYPDAKLMEPWRLKMKGQVMFEMPRLAAVRSMILNHSIHHRAQLGVYLRLLGVPLPPLYGPTADERP